MALVLGACLAASVVYAVLHWPKRPTASALPVVVVADAPVALDAAALSRLLGSEAAPTHAVAPTASSRFRLTGVIASGAGRGVALLSIDGNPPKPFRVGSAVDSGLVLHSVEARRVALANHASAPVAMWLDLPPKQP